jgi:hypothetical protein
MFRLLMSHLQALYLKDLKMTLYIIVSCLVCTVVVVLSVLLSSYV